MNGRDLRDAVWRAVNHSAEPLPLAGGGQSHLSPSTLKRIQRGIAKHQLLTESPACAHYSRFPKAPRNG